jgi:hypothetical protein
MNKKHTTKLFYKKYPFKLAVVRKVMKTDPDYYQGWTVDNAREWLRDNGIDDYKMYNRIINKRARKNPIIIRSSLFIKTRAEFEKCLAAWKANVVEITTPYKDEHIQFLTANTEIIIRQKLIYKKFRYVIVIKRHWQEDLSDFENWLNDNFTRETAKYTTSGWWPKLYLQNDNDLVLLKLAYGEKISKLSIVYTIDELESKI